MRYKLRIGETLKSMKELSFDVGKLVSSGYSITVSS